LSILRADINPSRLCGMDEKSISWNVRAALYIKVPISYWVTFIICCGPKPGRR
jgi:hypothetical protein